jgi:hypothetical protein
LQGVLRPVAADCEVNGAAGFNGTAGNDTIICDNNPAPATNAFVAGGVGGDDQIIIDSNAQQLVVGDGSAGPASLSSVAVAGNDTIVINGNTNAQVYGDFLNSNVNGGVDTITINGTVSIVVGDNAGGNATGGDDVIVVNGTVTGAVSGETQWTAGSTSTFVGGDDTITINGTTGSVTGDQLINFGTSIGGNDEIVINSSATVNGNVSGEMGATVGGNDTVTIVVGATITGSISGGNVAGDNDTIIFSGTTTDVAGYNQVQTFVGCNPCVGNVTIDGITYNFTNFEQLQNLLTLYIPPAAVVPVVITFSESPDDRINWGQGDWLAPIYNHQGAERGISVYWPADDLWIPESELPTSIPAENTLVGCNESGTVCLYHLAGSGYWQVNVNVVIDGLTQQVTVTFDSLNPTVVTSN